MCFFCGFNGCATYRTNMPKARSWNDYLTSQLIATGDVNQACLLGITDSNVWASANEFLPRLHKAQIMQDDGTEKETEINEAKIMLHTATELKKPAEGFWINGVKYMPLRTYPQGSANDGIGTIYFKKPKKGGCFCVLNTCVLIGTYDEAKQQTAASCNFAVEQLARYLHSNGF